MSASVPKNQVEVLNFVNICTLKEGILYSPKIWGLRKNGAYQIFQIIIGIFDKDDVKISITDKLINREEMPKGARAWYYTITGIEGGKQTESAKTYLDIGKNVNRNNYTTQLTQAIYDARGEYKKKVDSGYERDKANLIKNDGKINPETLHTEARGQFWWRVFPMLLHNYDKFPDKLKYPCYIQPKLDGTLALAVNNTTSSDIYSRGMETIESAKHIDLSWLSNFPWTYIVGELYIHGKSLQEISGVSRKQEKSEVKPEKTEVKQEKSEVKPEKTEINSEKTEVNLEKLEKTEINSEKTEINSTKTVDNSTKTVDNSTKTTDTANLLEYHLYDCFKLDQPDGFDVRYKNLSKMYSALTEDQKRYVKLVPTVLVQNQDELRVTYQKYVDQKYEGAVVRNTNSLYEYGISNDIRSYGTMKMKERQDAEFPVVGYKDGKGKSAGLIIWELAENDEGVVNRTKNLLPLNERKTFHCDPNMTHERRAIIFKYFEKNKTWFKDNIYGQLMTVTYHILSNDFLPQQPKAKCFRDLNIEKTLSDLN